MTNRVLPINSNSLENEKSLELHFSQLSYNYHDIFDNSQPILIDACGAFRSDRLTGIVGQSGAGKSTLISILSGYKFGETSVCYKWVKPFYRYNFDRDASGRVVIKGQLCDLHSFLNKTSYIAQNSVTPYLQTVQETLEFSAALKLPKSTSKKEKLKILDEIVELLDLHSVREKLVRDISGGEHKRLSVGIELITNPRIIFFDEPTSGLDNISSNQILGYLQKLAHQGRIVVCVINQPSSHLLHFFDDILMLSKGEVLYSGPQSDMLESFQKTGIPCSQYDNAGDFCEQWEENESLKQCCEKLIIQNKERNDCLQASVDAHSSEIDLFEKFDRRPNPEQRNFWFQLYVLLLRHLRCACRNLMTVLKRILLYFGAGILVGIFYCLFGYGVKKSFLICVDYWIFGNSIRSVLLIARDFPLVNREYCNAYYSLNAYFVSKIIADFPLQLFWSTLYFTTYYFGSDMSVSNLIIYLIGVSVLTMFSTHFAMFSSTSTDFLFIFSLYIRDFPFLPNLQYIRDYLNRPVYYYGRVKMLLNTELLYMKRFGHFFKNFKNTNDDFNWEITTLAIALLFVVLSNS